MVNQNAGWATWAFRNKSMGMFNDEPLTSYINWNDASQKNPGIYSAVNDIMRR